MRRRHVKRFSPPGTSPGTLAPPVETAAGPARLSLITYTGERAVERRLPTVEEAVARIGPGERAWLRIFGHETSVLGELAERVGVHPLVLEDVVNVGQRPKLEEHDSHLFIILDVLRWNGAGELQEEQVSLLLFENLLISIHERESDLFKPVEDRLNAQGSKMRLQAVDYLAYALIDAGVDYYFPALERVGERVDEVEDALLEVPTRETFEQLHRIKRELLRLRKATWPLREMVGAMSRTDSSLVREGTRLWLRDVYDHAVQIIDIIETFREMTAELADLYLSSVSNRMNEIMKVLTVIATIFMPLTFIVGLYGMNFQHMPELAWTWGYAAVWGVIAVVAAGMLWMFKRRGWL